MMFPLVACDAELEEDPTLYAPPGFVEVSVDEVVALFADRSEVVVIDVSPVEYQGAIAGAIPFPQDLGEARAQLARLDPDKDYLIVSAVEVDGALAAELLAANVIGTVYLFEGDDQYWNDAGLHLPSTYLSPSVTLLQQAVMDSDSPDQGATRLVPHIYAETEVDAETAKSIIEEMEGVRIIDVSPNSDAGYFPDAESFPYTAMGFVNPLLLMQDKEAPYLVHSQEDAVARVAARALVGNGFKQVFLTKGNVGAPGVLVDTETQDLSTAPHQHDPSSVPDELVRDVPDESEKYAQEIVWDLNAPQPDPVGPPAGDLPD